MKEVLLSAYTSEEIKVLFKEAVQETLVKLKDSDKRMDSLEYERLTRKEAMRFLKVGSSKFNELRRRGFVNPQRAGNRTYYNKQELITYCESLKADTKDSI